ncbi:MAG: radical SAM protein [Halioglobus sp.]
MPHKTQVWPLALANSEGTLPYLSLGMVVAYLRSYNDASLQEHYEINRLQIGGTPEYPLSGLQTDADPDGRPIYLLSSYVWNMAVNLEVATELKQSSPECLIIMGGPEVPKYDGETELFLTQNPAIDVAILGEGEVSCAEVLEALVDETEIARALASVPGIVFSSSDSIIRTEDRSRVKDINLLPSPYLTGEFGPWFHDFGNTILETNRGCPYGCTYCDWGSATLEKVTRFDLARVEAELEYLAARRSSAIFIADANFGMLEQDIAVATALVSIRERTGYPQRIYTNFAKNGGRRLMAVIKILHEGGLLASGIIALQTTDEKVLKAIKRDNIKTSSYEKMMTYFNSENIPMASDIMIGLPGQTVDSLQQDLQFCFEWKVSANGNYTSMMPNAPMAESSYREEFAITTDADGLIASTSTFSSDDLHYMKSLYMVYQFHVRLGVMKYYLYYVQLQFGIRAMDVLRLWLDAVLAQAPELPLSRRLFEEVIAMDRRSGDWALLSWGDEAEFFFADLEAYFDEFHAFAAAAFGHSLSKSEYETLRSTQATVVPRSGRSYPHRVDLPHDVSAYFKQLKQAPSIDDLGDDLVPLKAFSPGELVSRAKIKRRKNIRFAKIDGHSDDWELASDLRFY